MRNEDRDREIKKMKQREKKDRTQREEKETGDIRKERMWIN